MKRLRFFWKVLIISIPLLPVCLFLSASPLRAQPRISFDRQHMDFGKAQEGSAVRGKFTFTNTGDRPLVIEGFKAG